MGRMSDLWKSEQTTAVAPRPAAPVLEVMPSEPEAGFFDGVEDVPFIEVGAPSENKLRIAPVPAVESEPEPEPVVVAAPSPSLKLSADPLPEGLFAVWFRPVLPALPSGRGFGRELIAYHDPHHTISDQYRQLFGDIVLQLPNGSPRVLLLTGAAPEAGTTTVLLNLAATIARPGNARVTVVDANWFRPSLGERLGITGGPGLREVLAGRTPLPWALVDTRIRGVRALTAGRLPAEPLEVGIPPVIEKLKSECDWLLIDAPAWTSAAESVPLADCCDAIYLVVRQPDADTQEAIDLQQDFLNATGRLKGSIITQR